MGSFSLAHIGTSSYMSGCTIYQGGLWTVSTYSPGLFQFSVSNHVASCVRRNCAASAVALWPLTRCVACNASETCAWAVWECREGSWPVPPARSPSVWRKQLIRNLWVFWLALEAPFPSQLKCFSLGAQTAFQRSNSSSPFPLQCLLSKPCYVCTSLRYLGSRGSCSHVPRSWHCGRAKLLTG